MPKHAQQQNASQQASSSKATQPASAGIGQLGFEATEILNLQQSVGNHAVQRLLNSPAENITPAPQNIYRSPGGLVELTGVSVNHNRVTSPPGSGLSFKATKKPPNASGITFAIKGKSATIAAGTTIDKTSGVITLGAKQHGGSAQAEAHQDAKAPNGATLKTGKPAVAPFDLIGIPSGISSTSASAGGPASMYGGNFTHTFSAPGGSASELKGAHVNEQFPAASGTTLRLTGKFGPIKVKVNPPNSASEGWDLSASGKMAGPDLVAWDNTFSARPYVKNASNPSPASKLPQALSATQNFRNLMYPTSKYRAAAVATTTHKRAFEERSGKIKAVTTSGGQEIVDDYAGPTIYRNIKANPVSIQVAAPDDTAPATSTITVDEEGKYAPATFSVRKPTLGATIDAGGELTPGTKPGKVTVRAGDRKNYDEVTITLTPRPKPPAKSQTAGEEGEERSLEAAPEE